VQRIKFCVINVLIICLWVYGGLSYAIENIYLQTPTSTSIYICWLLEDNLAGSSIRYGPDTNLQHNVTCNQDILGDNEEYVWNWIRLDNLEPGTEYFYRCITGNDSSAINRFKTQLENDDDTQHIRFIAYGDSRTQIDDHTSVIEAMVEKVEELYGEDLHEEINLVLNMGDIVTSGQEYDQYQSEFFEPVNALSSSVPFMITQGNHDVAGTAFYDLMKYDDFASPAGEVYYSFRIGPVFFISLNSIEAGNTQLDWLGEILDDTEENDEVSLVIVSLHHPAQSETYPAHVSAWTRDDVVPLLENYSKVEILIYGHVHSYHRGVSTGSGLRFILQGGGGGPLYRWGARTPFDHIEIHRAIDHYSYSIFDIDCAENSYSMMTYSLGNEDIPLNNVLIDSFYHDRNQDQPGTPDQLPIYPALYDEGSFLLAGSYYEGDAQQISSQFQITGEEGDWNDPIINSRRDWENIFGNSGTPHYRLTDLNENIDLSTLAVRATPFRENHLYWWRMRYRDQNLKWSGWSQVHEFRFEENLAEFNLLSPADGSICHSGDTTLTWEMAAAPDRSDSLSYIVWWSSDANFIGTIDSAEVDSLSFDLFNLDDDTEYWWKVRAQEINHPGVWSSETRSIRTDMPNSPQPFNLLTPADSSNVWQAETMFTWSESSDSDYYDIPQYEAWLDTISDLSSAWLVGDNLEETQRFVRNLRMDKDYYWTVRATDSNTDGTWASDTFYFNTYQDLPRKESEGVVPTEYSIVSVYPNPFNSTLRIVVSLPDAEKLQLSIFNILGEESRRITYDALKPGYHNLVIDVNDFSSGIYFIHAIVPGKMDEYRKVVLIR